jgi:serine phosphatase RsbU (regulator of sigma subunit)/catechol 2,3-dioxygenase-like lactoylglutathione lyase family enzyme
MRAAHRFGRGPSGSLFDDDHTTPAIGAYNPAMASSSSSRWTDPSAPRLDGKEPYLRIFKFTIYVSDQDRSLRFYVDQLGFHLVYDVGFESGRRWLAVAPPDGSTVIVLVTPKPGSAEVKFIGQPSEIAFITEDVPAMYELWHARGVRFQHPPHTSTWGGTFTVFEDVDGNTFTLLGFDESSRQIEAQRVAIAERQEFERRAIQEMGIAKQVQARLFPQSLPPIKTLDYAGVCIQARAVGGDYYDYLNLGCERIGLVIGDIAGKGIAAALLMANLQANVRSQCAIALAHPQQFLQSVNRLFYENMTDTSYATLFFAEYDDKQSRLRYANCGHLPALLMRRDGAVERLDSTGTVLGLFQEWDCSVGERQLLPGDTLALYTDGITESFNDADEEFGEQRLIEVLRRHGELPAQALLSLIVEAVRQFSSKEQHDDITLIIAKCRAE